ncbi:MAG: DoxX family membrane protein [Deltaproteobacteria bacterium]|nr:DoxX family membrane protein [Deltaproteobacteria bacterium]
MNCFYSLFDRVDRSLTASMARHGILMLRVSVGVIFLWFGVLKFFPGMSPAQDLAAKTIGILTFGLVPTKFALMTLATWECAVGLGLMFGVFLRATLLLLWLQMIGTAAPLLFFPNESFTYIPYAPTLEGQYIIKNLVLASAGLVVGATVRGGRLSP